MTAMFLMVSVLNNYAFTYIDMPLHIVFKSSSLMVNMLIGRWFLQRRYPQAQQISVVVVSLGVLLTTLASSSASSGPKQLVEGMSPLYRYLVGILVLGASLVLTSLLGLYQEQTYRVYGKQWEEGLWYTHVLALPFFVFMWRDIVADVQAVYQSHDPLMLVYLCVNAYTQYMCIKSVHQLSCDASSLTVNLILTARKFISLLLSVIYFSAPYGRWHVTGTVLVFVGTLMYTRATQMFHQEHQARRRSHSSITSDGGGSGSKSSSPASQRKGSGAHKRRKSKPKK